MHTSAYIPAYILCPSHEEATTAPDAPNRADGAVDASLTTAPDVPNRADGAVADDVPEATTATDVPNRTDDAEDVPEIECVEVIEPENSDLMNQQPPKSHFVNHRVFHPNCTTCRVGKQGRSHAKRQDPDIKEKSSKYLGRVSFDHLDSRAKNGIGHKRYGLVINDEATDLYGWHSSSTRQTSEVEDGLRSFSGKRLQSIEELYCDSAGEFLKLKQQLKPQAAILPPGGQRPTHVKRDACKL